MTDVKNIKTLGRNETCDVRIDHSSVSPVHAHIELADDGLVSVQEADSGAEIFLNRNNVWIRIRRVTLCIGDSIRLGEIEIPLHRLTAVFGSHSNARLESKHFALRNKNSGNRLFSHASDQETSLQKPRRNPLTGKIEENRGR